MASKILWAAESEASLLTTELNNAADAATIVDGADYVNGTNKFQFADFLFFGTFDAACDADAIIELHIFYKLDGTHYGDGEDGDVGGAVASGNSLHGIFIVGAQADVYQQILGVPLAPKDFKVAVKLSTGQALTAVDTHWLKMYPHNHESQ